MSRRSPVGTPGPGALRGLFLLLKGWLLLNKVNSLGAVSDPNGLFTSDELARIQDAINGLDDLLAPYSVTVNEVTDPTVANLIIDIGATSAAGSASDGVLGCETTTTDSTEISILQGWNWYAGSDPTAVGSDEYDFQTVITHELGHALGIGHNTDPSSVMYWSLATGTARRTMTVADLNIPDAPGGADPLMAAGFQPSTTAAATSASGAATTLGSAINSGPAAQTVSPTTAIAGSASSQLGALLNANASAFSPIVGNPQGGSVFVAGGAAGVGTGSSVSLVGQGTESGERVVGGSLWQSDRSFLDLTGPISRSPESPEDGAAVDPDLHFNAVFANLIGMGRSGLNDRWVSQLSADPAAQGTVAPQAAESATRAEGRSPAGSLQSFVIPQTGGLLDSALDELASGLTMWGAGDGLNAGLDGRAGDAETGWMVDAAVPAANEAAEETPRVAGLAVAAGFASFAAGLLVGRNPMARKASARKPFARFQPRVR